MNDSVFLSLNGLTYYDERLKEHIRSSFGSTMTVEWEPIENGKNPFKLKIALKNGHGTELFSKIVDFPLEQTIVSGEYEDSPEEGGDDAIAALRYAIEGVRKPRKIERVRL